MAKRSLRTPRSQVKHTLQQLFLRSREHSFALKRDGYTCQICGKKQSRAKGKEVYVELHHIDAIAWQHLIDMVYEMLLCDPGRLQTLCKECHENTK